MNNKNSDFKNDMNDKEVLEKTEESLNEMSSFMFEHISSQIDDSNNYHQIHTSQFLEGLFSLWGEGFSLSRFMYTLSSEIIMEYSNYVNENVCKKSLVYIVLQHLQGRILQQYLEVLTLLENGLADGAYARCRSIYELTCIIYFITSSSNKEELANNFYKHQDDDSQNYSWASSDTRITTKKNITFNTIQQKCCFENWLVSEYKFTCNLVHSSPKATFGRLSNIEDMNAIAIGRSNAGISLPATQSAHLLLVATTIFVNEYPNVDSMMQSKVLLEIFDELMDIYTKIESKIEEDKENAKYSERKRVSTIHYGLFKTE